MLNTVVLYHVGEAPSKRSKKFPLTEVLILTMSQDGVNRLKRLVQHHFGIADEAMSDYILTKSAEYVTKRNDILPFCIEVRPVDEKHMLVTAYQVLQRLQRGLLDITRAARQAA